MNQFHLSLACAYVMMAIKSLSMALFDVFPVIGSRALMCSLRKWRRTLLLNLYLLDCKMVDAMCMSDTVVL